MSSRNGFQATDLALIAVFAALVAVLAVIPPMFMVGAVPFALQMVAVMLAPMVLGSIRGGCAVGLYILVGALGLPVFSGGSSGIGVLVGPTGGYLWGWLIGAFVAGAVATSVLRRRPRKSMLPVWLFVVALVDLVCVYLGGIFGLMGFAKLSLLSLIHI